MNELQHEKSPYLLQHAGNPVNWYPWGQAAFDIANRERKSILLRVGCSTCHWCHVMGHESFEDRAVAEAINRDYIPIKVDREERPSAELICTVELRCGHMGCQPEWNPDEKSWDCPCHGSRFDRFGRLISGPAQTDLDTLEH